MYSRNQNIFIMLRLVSIINLFQTFYSVQQPGYNIIRKNEEYEIVKTPFLLGKTFLFIDF